MRTIEFRGKDCAGTWWHGYPSLHEGNPVIHPMQCVGASMLVDEDTIGQFTGLTDKNGVKIFEGDIVKYGNTLHEVVFCDFADNVYFGIWFADRGKIWAFSPSVAANRMTVIGNIHDSPELIEDMDIKPAAKMSDTPAEQLGLAPAT